MVSVGALVGAAVGVGLPLLIALIIALIMLRREKKRFAKPKLMYKLPEECQEEDYAFRPPPSVPSVHPALRPDSSRADTASAYSSRRGSFRTAAASPSPRPMQGTFMERYEGMKKNAHGQMHEVTRRHELDSTPPYQEVERHEMGDYRRSQSSTVGKDG